MKFRNFILSLLFLTSNINFCAQSMQLNKKAFDLAKKFEFEQMILNINVHNNAESSALAKAKNFNTTDLMQVCEQKLTDSKKHIANLKDYILKNKLKISVYSLGGLYSYTFYNIFKLNHLINAKDSWVFWKSDIAFDKFLALQQKGLINELIGEIQKKYCAKSNPDDAITPLILFANEIDKNLNYLNQYIKFLKIINFLRIAKIFFVNEKTLVDAQEKLNRLIYLKTLFSAFTAEFKQQKLFASIDNKVTIAPAA